VIRLVLILCYLSTAFTAPRPCCCATTPAEQPTAPPEKSACPLCAAEKKPEPTPAPAKKHKCPCPKAEVKAPPVTRAADDGRPWLPADAAAGERPLPPAHTPVVRVVHPGLPPDPSPHLPRLPHRLRC
jgi:hypothetical protein